jgi:hypothetical protein
MYCSPTNLDKTIFENCVPVKVMTLPTIISGEYAIFVFPKAVKTPSLVKKILVLISTNSHIRPD